MSSTEETELKAGHPPADKVGGMRVSRPHHTSAPATAEKEDAGKTEEGEETVPGPPKPSAHDDVLVSGAVIKEDKAFPVEAVKHYHDKPHTKPSKEPRHDVKAKQTHNIQQPR